MFRSVVLRGAALSRGLHTTVGLRAEEAVASKHTTEKFLAQWRATAPPQLEPPILPSNIPAFAAASAAEIPATIPEKLTFTFYMPHSKEMSNEKAGRHVEAPHVQNHAAKSYWRKAHGISHGEVVDMVLIPGAGGDFGVLPGHVPTVSALKPGVMEVHKTDKDIVKYFVSSGFAFVHPDSTAEVCAVEAVPLEHLDGAAVKESLAAYNTALVNAKDDYEKAAAQIGIEVASAMNSALGQA